MRLAGLMGLTSGEDTDRVRAVIARVALSAGNVAAACDVLSAAVLRRHPRRGHGHAGGGEAGAGGEGEVGAFPAELCEALDLVVEQACVAGSARSSGKGASLCVADFLLFFFWRRGEVGAFFLHHVRERPRLCVFVGVCV